MLIGSVNIKVNTIPIVTEQRMDIFSWGLRQCFFGGWCMDKGGDTVALSNVYVYLCIAVATSWSPDEY